MDNQFLKSNGIFYTNTPLASKMVELLGINYQEEFTILEPAVGEGHIFITVIEKFLENNLGKSKKFIKQSLENNFCAFDIRKEAIEKCILKLDILVSKYYEKLKINWKIFVFDALNKQALKGKIGNFDYVISNPPYIARKNMSEEMVRKLKLNSLFCNKFNFDIYYFFFELGVESWNQKGKMVYITPNSYLKARSAENMLSYFIENQLLESIIDFEDNLKFENATTYTAISVFSKNNDALCLYKETTDYKEKITYADLKDRNQIYIYDRGFEIVDTEEYVELGEIAEIRNGLATLNDKIFIIKESDFVKETRNHIIIDRCGVQYPLEKSGLRLARRASKINERNYVIFPYDKNNYKIDNLPKKLPKIYRYLKNTLPSSYKEKYGLYYGRTQGLRNFSKPKIVIPKVAYLNNEAFKIVDTGFTLSGLSIVFNESVPLDSLQKINDYLNSEAVLKFLAMVSKNYSSGYKSMSSTNLKNIKIPKKILE